MNEFTKVKTLLGHKGLSFSIECLQSFVQNATDKIWLIIFEDGTLTIEDKEKLKISFPASNLIEKIKCEAIILKKLEAYPACLEYRKTVIYARKIFDLMLYDNEDILYIDSDIYFIRRFSLPQFGDTPVFMCDSINAYSFNPSEFISVNYPIFPKVNSGFFFFPNTQFDINYIEHILQNSIIHKGYLRGISWLEQTIWSFLASRVSLYYFDTNQVIMATENSELTEHTVCVHLVSTYRGQFEKIKKDKERIKNTDQVILINLTRAKQRLKIYDFYAERIMRKLKRYW